jgi:hypothetical protein
MSQVNQEQLEEHTEMIYANRCGCSMNCFDLKLPLTHVLCDFLTAAHRPWFL